MSNHVQVYVYDLSNGMARQLSRQLTGKQIDGVWHTSVVVFNREIFYGQGISETAPGQSHHGRPLQIIDIGETAIDEETFDEYLSEMRNTYTADKYHLLEFNCNSFTNDAVGFLTGLSIPSWITDLPSDFLSTPFGQALRPTIDAMYRRPVPGTMPAPNTVQPSPQAAAAAAAASPNPALASALLQAVAAQAAGAGPSPSGTSTPSTSTMSAPIHICSNPSSFHNTLKTHRAVIAFFTSATCPPCRMIEPVFERLAYERTQTADTGGRGGGVAFVKVDLGAGMGNMVGSEYSVRVTPTFLFFKDGNKTNEMKGANAAELESQVNFLLWETFPPHPHTQKKIPALDSLSTDPILFTQVPALDTVFNKLVSFIDAASPPVSAADTVKTTLSTEVLPYLTARFPSNNPKARGPSATPQLLTKWTAITLTLSNSLPPAQLFPLADMWRLALLDDAVSTWCASQASPASDPLQILLDHAVTPDPPRNYLLVVLRMAANAFATPLLAQTLVSAGTSRKQQNATKLLVASLLHADAHVRTAAASLAFNVAACVQRGRLEQVRSRQGYVTPAEEDGDWEVELVSAILEALQNEVQNEDIVHRLTASLAFLLRFSPVYDTQLAPLLEVLQAKETLKAKLKKGGCGEDGVKSPPLRKLIGQVADNLC